MIYPQRTQKKNLEEPDVYIWTESFEFILKDQGRKNLKKPDVEIWTESYDFILKDQGRKI